MTLPCRRAAVLDGIADQLAHCEGKTRCLLRGYFQSRLAYHVDRQRWPRLRVAIVFWTDNRSNKLDHVHPIQFSPLAERLVDSRETDDASPALFEHLSRFRVGHPAELK